MASDRFYFEEAVTDWQSFKTLVTEGFGKNIKRNSTLESIAQDVIKMLESYRTPQLVTVNADYRSRWRRACGLNDFVRKILMAKDLAEFSTVWPLIEKFFSEKTIVVQNEATPLGDSDANVLFELYFALLLIHFVSDLKIDIGHAKKGKRPDLIFQFEGINWAIECKTPGSAKVKSYKDKVLDGVQQIEEVDDDVERGFVALNMRNSIEHEKFWPLEDEKDFTPATYSHKDYAYDNLVSFRPTNSELWNDFGGAYLKELMEDWKRARHFTLNFFSSTALVLDDQVQKIALFRTFQPLSLDHLVAESNSEQTFHTLVDFVPDDHDRALLNCLQEALHDRL